MTSAGTALGLDPVQRLLEDRQLLVATDQHGLHAQRGTFPSTFRRHRQGVPCRNWLRLSLQGERRQLGELDHVLHGREHARTHDDVPWLGRGLQSGGDVHGVAGEHPVARTGRALEVDEHFAGLDADPHRELWLALSCEPSVQLGQDREHLQRGTNCPLGVIFVGFRDTEHRQHGVAHELLEVSPVALDLSREPVEGASHYGLHDLGVLLLGEGGRADEVSEERGRVLALHARRRGALLERGAAMQAELRVRRVLAAARPTGSHPRSLRPASMVTPRPRQSTPARPTPYTS